jgi:histone H3/H4
MIELAGDMTHKSKRKHITPRDIALVIKNDEELVSISFIFLWIFL